MKKLMPELGAILPVPQDNPIVTEFLQNRRSNLAKDFKMGENQTPLSQQQIEHILSIAARVPDHRKLAPWRFILWQGGTRVAFGEIIKDAFLARNPNLAAESSDNVKERIQFEEDRFMRAPLVIGVVSSPIECPRGTPKWEQELSAGALCFNLCLAAQSMGFAAQWLTEWYAYDSKVLAAAGLAPSEKMAGYIYIGQTDSAPAERARPELLNKVTNWPG